MILLSNQWSLRLKLVIKFILHFFAILILNCIYFVIIYYNIFRLDKFINVYKIGNSTDAAINMIIIVYLIPILLSYIYYFIFIFRKENFFFKITFFILALVLSQQPYSYYIKDFLG